MTSTSVALVIYDDRFARMQKARGATVVKRDIRWGGSTSIVDGKIEPRHAGVGYEAITIDLGGPMRLRHYDEHRYPEQGFSCFGCPHLAVDIKYGSPHCAHPFYVELWGCPQSVAARDFSAPARCPMLGMRSEAAQRRYRWHVKSSAIFWEYYHDSGRDPWREGFRVYR